MKAIGKHIVVLKEKEEEARTGLYLGKRMPDGISKGEVKSVGTEVGDAIIIGDTVHYQSMRGIPIRINDEEYETILMDDVLVVE